MKKATVTIVSLFLLSISSVLIAQPSGYAWIAEFDNSYGSTRTFNLNAAANGYHLLTVQATSADDEYVIEWDTFNNKWRNGSTPIDTEFTLTHGGSGLSNGVMASAVTIGNYYTFVIQGLDYSDRTAIVMETSASPIEISSSSVNTVTNDSIFVDITLSASKSSEEKIYLRYSTDNFSTSKHVLATSTGGGSGYQAAVPFTSDITYYILSTTVDLGDDNTTYSGDYDLVTLDLLNNGGSNYTYTYGFNVEISGSAGWRLLSLPITGGTVSDISDDTPVQGITGGDNASADANFYIYDDTGSFEEPTDVSTAWGDGYGFALYFFDNTSAGSAELPVTLDATGTENSSGPCIVLNTFTTPGSVGTGGTGETNSHYTLIGNPFATNFDVNTISSEGDFPQNEIQFWNDGLNTYEQGDASSSYIIAPWQAFWIEMANGQDPGELCFGTGGKTTSATSGTYFSKSVENRGDIKFTLTSETTTDKALKLAFRDYATFEYDRADASKLVPLVAEYATLAFRSNDRLKSVESLPWKLEEEVKIDLEEQFVGVSGEFTLDWNGLESIPSDWMITFHDYETGQNIDMRSESKYVFDAEAPVAQKVNPLTLLKGPAAVAQKSKSAGTRFGITITPTTSVNNEEEGKVNSFALSQNYPNPFNPTTTINYSVENAGHVTISVYNLMGQKVAELVNESKAAGSYNVTWNAANAASGMYYYRLESGGQTMTRKMTLIK